MSVASQKKNMLDIHRLISRDLGYLPGDRECGPNGAKRIFLTNSAAFLRALGKDLSFTEMKVATNPAGIAVSGDVSLYGMWGESNGLCLYISQPVINPPAFLYRSISSLKDYRGGANQWVSCSLFEAQDYDGLINTLLSLKTQMEELRYAA
jgi:hypothetical protein